MSVDDRIHCLRSLDLFAGFSDHDLRALAMDLTEKEYAAGGWLVREGEPGEEMFILLAGLLRVCKGKKTITEIRPVDYIGEMALIEAMPRSASIQVVEPSRILAISSGQFFKYLAGQPRSLVVMMRTLSSRVRKDTELLAEEFERANILVHDMRNMLCPFSFLNGMAETAVDENEIRRINVMIRARDNLALMMEEALANAKRLAYEPLWEKGSLGDLVAEVVTSELLDQPDLANCHLSFEIEEGLPEFTFNHLEIRRVLANLLINAGQASADGGSIVVSVVGGGDHAVVSVADHGKGIPADAATKIFQAHFTTKTDGNGLGLASCRRIIEEHHGGVLSFRPNQAGGAVFTFTLPYERPFPSDGADSSPEGQGRTEM